MNEWIKCGEQMPQMDARVLVYMPRRSNQRVRVAIWWPDEDAWCDGEEERSIDREKVSHWMPLPAEPSRG